MKYDEKVFEKLLKSCKSQKMVSFNTLEDLIEYVMYNYASFSRSGGGFGFGFSNASEIMIRVKELKKLYLKELLEELK